MTKPREPRRAVQARRAREGAARLRALETFARSLAEIQKLAREMRVRPSSLFPADFPERIAGQLLANLEALDRVSAPASGPARRRRTGGPAGGRGPSRP